MGTETDDEDVVTLTVPDGMAGGDILLLELDDGEEMEVPIPAGLNEGDEFEIDLDNPPAVLARPDPAELVEPPPLPKRLDPHFDSTGRELRTAAQRDDQAALAAALKHTDVNSADLKTGNTALHWAAVLDHPTIVLALLGANADMTLTNRNGATPWDQAVAKGGRKHVPTPANTHFINPPISRCFWGLFSDMCIHQSRSSSSLMESARTSTQALRRSRRKSRRLSLSRWNERIRHG